MEFYSSSFVVLEASFFGLSINKREEGGFKGIKNLIKVSIFVVFLCAIFLCLINLSLSHVFFTFILLIKFHLVSFRVMLCNIRFLYPFHYKSKFNILPVNPFVPRITIFALQKTFPKKHAHTKGKERTFH